MKAGQGENFKKIGMKNLRTLTMPVLLMSFVLVLLSCSKEEDPVEVVDVEVSSFDRGYLLIKVEPEIAYLDSLIYTNLTKGTTFTIYQSELGFNQNSNIAIYSKPIINGNRNDAVQCCAYLNHSVEVGVAFEDLRLQYDSLYLDSIPSVITGANNYQCFNGSY